MITITYEKVMAALGLFTAACVAAGWLIRIINGAKAPGLEIHKKLDTDKKRLDDHDEQIAALRDMLDYLVNSNNLIIRSLFTVLGELAVNNDADGKIKSAQDDIHKFLTPVDS